VALGHHLDDAVETFYMNLWREGRIGCFSPVTYLSQRDLTLIRPMLLATEYEVQCAVREAGLPIVKSRCPADGVTDQRICAGALPHRPRLPPKDPPCFAGERH
jgi:tRNA 2-thiocytidine biosynthesis protein TtcA